MDLSLSIITILLSSGLLVGFTNTLAGGGSAISLTIFMALGLPAPMANGTNRVAIFMQNLSSTATFTTKKQIDWASGWRLSIPTVLGVVVGSQIAATQISDSVFRTCLAVVMVTVLFFTLFSGKLFKGGGEQIGTIRWWHYALFFAIGAYNGFIFVGTGYLILLVAMGFLRLDIVRSNILKNLVILISMLFSLSVFVLNGNVNWTYGLIHGVGNMVGAFLASHYAIGWGVKFLRWFMVGVVVVCIADVLGLISIRQAVLSVIS
jgi:uncharacterized membrane protein YfcA